MDEESSAINILAAARTVKSAIIRTQTAPLRRVLCRLPYIGNSMKEIQFSGYKNLSAFQLRLEVATAARSRQSLSQDGGAGLIA